MEEHPMLDVKVEVPPIDRLSNAGLLDLGKSASDELKTLSVQIYLNLREALLAGVLSSGDQLSIRSIAAAFGTSAMPVRDAMTRLVVDGGLAALANRAYIVPQLSEIELLELSLMRRRLETLAAERAATRQTLSSLREIKETYERLLAPKSAAAYLADHRNFHFQIYDCADMPYLRSTIETIWLRMGPILKKHLNNADINEENVTHGNIVKALQHGDPNQAAVSVEEDVRLGTTKMVTMLG